MSLRIGSKGELVKRLQQALGITADGVFGEKTEIAVKIFQTSQLLTVDGIAGSATFKALVIAFDDENPNHIMWELPSTGIGYRSYNRGKDDSFGVKKTIDAIVHIGLEWHKISPDLNFQVGDISRQHRGTYAPSLYPHKSHRRGVDVDLRPLTDEGYIPIDWRSPAYGAKSEALNEKFVRLVRKLYPNARISFNDEKLRDKGLTNYLSEHDNHYHIKFVW